MSWTQGQQNRTNQSPFIDPVNEDRNHQKPPQSSGYARQSGQRNDYNQRPQYTQRTPQSPQTRDVAATFTQEGLQTFSMIFSSAVEAAIVKTLPDLVERAVDRKMQEFLSQARFELDKMASTVATQVTKEITDALTREQSRTEVSRSDTESVSTTSVPMATTADVSAPAEEPQASEATLASTLVNETVDATATVATPATEDVVSTADQKTSSPTVDAVAQPQGSSRTTGRIGAELEAVKKVLKDFGRPVKIEELKNALPDVHWGRNPSIKMSGLVQKSEGQIERVARGAYQFHQA